MYRLITQNGVEIIEVKGDEERFTIVHRLRQLRNGYKCSVFNRREAEELRDFITEWLNSHKQVLSLLSCAMWPWADGHQPKCEHISPGGYCDAEDKNQCLTLKDMLEKAREGRSE